jgi:hypothetical protein
VLYLHKQCVGNGYVSMICALFEYTVQFVGNGYVSRLCAVFEYAYSVWVMDM